MTLCVWVIGVCDAVCWRDWIVLTLCVWVIECVTLCVGRVIGVCDAVCVGDWDCVDAVCVGDWSV